MQLNGAVIEMGGSSENGVESLPDTEPVDRRRRRVLVTTALVVGGAGLVASGIPFVASMRPSARARAAGAPVQVDISHIEAGQQIVVAWQGKPVWILRRTPEMLRNLRDERLIRMLRDPWSEVKSQQPSYITNDVRALRPEYLVVIGICTHLGCSPNFRPDIAPPDLGPEWLGGYFCPCHGSRFDLAGRVFKDVPAPINLKIPPHRYLRASTVMVGEDAA